MYVNLYLLFFPFTTVLHTLFCGQVLVLFVNINILFVFGIQMDDSIV